MYNKTRQYKGTFDSKITYEAETIEQKVNRILNNKEPITDGAPLIYSERKDGVNPAHDIRTDRWDIAIDAMDLVSKDHTAKREARILKMNEENKPKTDGGAEPTQSNTNS